MSRTVSHPNHTAFSLVAIVILMAVNAFLFGLLQSADDGDLAKILIPVAWIAEGVLAIMICFISWIRSPRQQ